MTMTFDKLVFKSPLFTDSEIRALAIREVEATLSRGTSEAAQGRNVDGGALRAYSKPYAELKSAAGFGSNTNLIVTKELQGSKEAIEIPGGAEGFFAGSHDLNSAAKLAAGTKGKKLSPDAHRVLSSFLSEAKTHKSNATIAAELIDRGFIDWFAFGKKDIERIDKVLDKFLDDKLKKLIEVQPGKE